MNNIKTRGTIDNAGRLYRYMKYDFYFKNHDTGSLLILIKENNFLEFMTKWGVLVSVIILLVAFGGLLFLNHLLKKPSSIHWKILVQVCLKYEMVT